MKRIPIGALSLLLLTACTHTGRIPESDAAAAGTQRDMVAIAVYVLIAIIRKRAWLPHMPYALLQILSVTLFEKTPLFQALSEHQQPSEPPDVQIQQCLPGFLTGQ